MALLLECKSINLTGLGYTRLLAIISGVSFFCQAHDHSDNVIEVNVSFSCRSDTSLEQPKWRSAIRVLVGMGKNVGINICRANLFLIS